jgi:predicted Zn-dependent protease
MKTIGLAFIFIIFISGCFGPEETYSEGTKYSKEELQRLQSQAAKIDELTNVTAREYFEVYMKLSDAYSCFGNDIEALKAIKSGLQLNSWDYGAQLKAAKLEIKLDKKQDAYSRLIYLIQTCPDKNVLDEGKRLVDEMNRKDKISISMMIPPKFDYKIYLARIGKVDDLYIESIKSRIVQEYKINVDVLSETIEPSLIRYRNTQDRYFTEIVKNFVAKYGQIKYMEILKTLSLDTKEPFSKSNKKEFVHSLYLRNKNGEGQWRQMMSFLQDQYDADELVDQLWEKYKNLINKPKVFGILGVTSVDIYSEDYNFLFGSYCDHYAVMSCNRFVSDDSKLSQRIKRIVMQSFSSTGFLIGIPRCTIPNCSRAYPHSLEEHDRKDDILCTECKRNLIERYNKL